MYQVNKFFNYFVKQLSIQFVYYLGEQNSSSNSLIFSNNDCVISPTLPSLFLINAERNSESSILQMGKNLTQGSCAIYCIHNSLSNVYSLINSANLACYCLEYFSEPIFKTAEVGNCSVKCNGTNETCGGENPYVFTLNVLSEFITQGLILIIEIFINLNKH